MPRIRGSGEVSGPKQGRGRSPAARHEGGRGGVDAFGEPGHAYPRAERDEHPRGYGGCGQRVRPPVRVRPVHPPGCAEYRVRRDGGREFGAVSPRPAGEDDANRRGELAVVADEHDRLQAAARRSPARQAQPGTPVAMVLCRGTCAEQIDRAGRTGMAERLGCASQSCRLAAGPTERAAARARRLCVRVAGLAHRMSARSARSGQRSPGPAASAGLTRFAPSAIASRRRRLRNPPSRIPPSPRACCARPGTGRPSALADCGGDDRTRHDRVPALTMPFPVKATGIIRSLHRRRRSGGPGSGSGRGGRPCA
jgi:hypothetical protein